MPKTVSFDLPKSPWEQEREDIAEEKRRIALERMAQLQRPLQGEMVSGHYIAPSWTQGLAQAVGQWLGRKDMGHLSDKEKKSRESEQVSLVTDVQKWLDALATKPGTPEQVTEEVGRMVDPPEYWKPAPAQTFGLDQAPEGQPLQMETSENPAIADPEALGAALANEYGMSRLPPGTDFKQYTQPPFVPPSMSEVPQATPQVNQMPPMASAPPMTRRVIPGQPERPANPREALMIALSSKHPMLQQLAMQQLAQQTGTDEGAITRAGALRAMQYLTPESVAQMMGDPALGQLKMRNDLMTVAPGAAVMEKSNPQGQLLPATQGRFDKPFQRGGDWYQVDKATGQEHKLDNAPNLSVTVQGPERAYEAARGKDLATDVTAAVTQGRVARGMLPTLDYLAKLNTQTPTSGPLAEFGMAITSLANQAGFDVDSERLATDEVYRGQVNKQIVDTFMNATGGAHGFTEMETKLLASSYPQINMNPKARATVIQVMKAKLQRDIGMAEKALQEEAQFSPRLGAMPKVRGDVPMPSTPTPKENAPLSQDEMRELEELRAWQKGR